MFAERISDWLLATGFASELVIIVIAALPVIELRGAIPFGINFLGLDWFYVLPLAILGTFLPVPFILLFLEGASRVLSRFPVFDRFFTWLFTRTRKRSRIIEKSKRAGLAIFVSIPLPITGAWTGSLAAVLLGMSRGWASLSIFIGVVTAGIIVTILSVLGWLGAAIAGVILCGFVGAGIWSSSS